MLLGRQDEIGTIEGALAGVRRGQATTLLLVGEMGIGKTSLLNHAADAAEDVAVVRLDGVPSELHANFAALQTLIAGWPNPPADLPQQQAQALAVAIGEQLGRAPDALVLGLAVLGTLRSTDRPLMLLIDDVQWIDTPTVLALAFAARRLADTPIALIVAGRPGAATDHLSSAIPRRALKPLDVDQARELLATSLHLRLDAAIEARVIEEAAGNPLALLELVRAAESDGSSSDFGLTDELPVTTRVERRFEQQWRTLRPAARSFVLIAASDPTADPDLLWHASDIAGIGSHAASEAQAAGMLDVGTQVTFRHPLIRSAVYGASDAADRRRAHAALAQAMEGRRDGDHQAWHEAQAAARPDGALATALEARALKALGHGEFTTAASFLRRAAELSPESTKRAERLLAAARATADSGAPDAANAVLNRVRVANLSPPSAAEAIALRGRLLLSLTRGPEAVGQLLDAAEALWTLDRQRARSVLLDGLTAAIAGQDVAGLKRARELQRTWPTALRRTDDRLLEGLISLLDGDRAEGVKLLRTTIGRVDDASLSSRLILCALATCECWDLDLLARLGSAQTVLARESGALDALAMSLSIGSCNALFRARPKESRRLAEESLAIAHAIGVAPFRYSAILYTGLDGSADSPSRFTELQREATQRGEATMVALVGVAAAMWYGAHGRFPEAGHHAEAAAAAAEFPHRGLALLEAVHAHAHSGDTDGAERALVALRAHTTASATPWAAGVERWASAMASSGGDPEPAYRAALELLERADSRLHLGRAELGYGEWLRRRNRRGEARVQLQAAQERLTGADATAFARRATRELRALGARPTRASSNGGLTPQERLVAERVAAGATSKEVATELVLSPRTVEAHLRSIFRKLDVSSRRELRRRDLG